MISNSEFHKQYVHLPNGVCSFMNKIENEYSLFEVRVVGILIIIHVY